MLVSPLLVSAEIARYLAAPVWLGFIFLLDPINARLGGDSLLAEWRGGRFERTINLALSGMLCGILWELWNFWAHAKWHYTVPIMEDLKIFEMPVPGYFGFPPFALECFTMTSSCGACCASAAVRSESELTPAIDRALVLTAGLGTRLRPLTDVRAKPAMPVAGEPMIRRIIRWLVSRGVSDLVLNLHHLPHTLTAVVGDGADLDARVRYSWEQPRVLGSAGGPRLALPLVAADTFFVINGDTLTDVDLRAIARAHLDSGALVTLALVPNEEYDRYGGVLLDDERRVTGFVRRGPSAKGSYHFIGVQVAHASASRAAGAR